MRGSRRDVGTGSGGGGYEVLLARQGEDAMKQLARDDVDAVVSDVKMHGMDGLELTRRIRKLPGMAQLPVVLVTNLASEEDRREGMRAGASVMSLISSRSRHR